MRSRFVPFDDALIERVFQPLADAMSDRLGLDRLAAACFCTDLASVGWVLAQARSLSDAVLGWDVGIAAARLMLLLLGLLALAALRGMFRRVSGAAQANPLRAAMRPHRAVLLLMLVARLMALDPLSLAGVADLAMLWFAGAALYLAACAARPPVQRRTDALEQLT